MLVAESVANSCINICVAEEKAVAATGTVPPVAKPWFAGGGDGSGVGVSTVGSNSVPPATVVPCTAECNACNGEGVSAEDVGALASHTFGST